MLERYHRRYWIECNFREAKLFMGLHIPRAPTCQTEKHGKLSFNAALVANVAHWLPKRSVVLLRGRIDAISLRPCTCRAVFGNYGIEPVETKNSL